MTLTSVSTALCWSNHHELCRSHAGEGCPSSHGGKDSPPHLLGCPEGTTSTQPPTATTQAKFSSFPALSPSLRQPKIQLRSWDAATAHQLSPSRARQLCPAFGVIYSTAHVPCPLSHPCH